MYKLPGILKTFALSWVLFLPLSHSAQPDHVKFDLTFDDYKIPHADFIIDGYSTKFSIDTGSALGFHLKENEMKQIKDLKKSREYRSTDASGRIQKNSEYIAKTINLNGLILSDVIVAPFKSWGMVFSGEGELPDSPVIGLDAFKNRIITLDYHAQSMTIANNATYSGLLKNFGEYDFNLTRDGLMFEVEQSDIKYHFILDTGATTSVIWKERLKKHRAGKCLVVDPDMDNIIDDKGCEATEMTLISKQGQEIKFGAFIAPGNFKHMDRIDGLLGNNLIKKRVLIIDFQNKKLFISKDEQKET